MMWYEKCSNLGWSFKNRISLTQFINVASMLLLGCTKLCCLIATTNDKMTCMFF